MTTIAMKELHPSPTDYRKALDAAQDAELLESVKQHGILTPLLVRKRAAGGYEVVLGSRRYRAAKGAGLADVPAEVRELDVATARELQLVENGQRADVHPLDESDAFRALVDDYKYDAERVAKKVSKPVAHVRRRLQLVHLGPAGRKAWLAGQLTEDAAYVLSRVPAALQAKAASDAIEQNTPNEWAAKNGEKFEPVSGAEMRRVVREDLTLPLADARFPIGDATLLPKAGPCTTCPKQTGAQPALFADLAAKGDTCTDPTCWKDKGAAQYERLVAEAKAQPAKKLVVLTAAEVKKVFPFSHDQLAHDCGYEEIDGAARAKLEKAGTPVYAAKTPDGDPVLLARVADVKKVAAASPAKKPKVDEKVRAKKAADRDKLKRANAIGAAAHAALVGAIVAAAERGLDDEDRLRALIRLELARQASTAMQTGVARRRGLSLEDASTGKGISGEEALTRFIATAKRAALRGLYVELLVEVQSFHLNYIAEGDEIFGPGVAVAALLKELGVNAKAAWAGGVKAAEKALDAAAAKRAGAATSAAGTGKKAGKKPAAKKPRTRGRG